MNKRVNYIWTLMVLLLIAAVPAGAQSLKKADMYYSGGAYYGAAELYKEAIGGSSKDVEGKRGEVMYRIGECYRRMNKPEEAQKWYAQAQTAGYEEADLYYGLGCTQLMRGEYPAAKASFTTSKDKNPGDARLESKLASCDVYERYSIPNPQYELIAVDNLNTKGSEYGLAFYGEQLIYASTGIGGKGSDISERTGFPYSNLYIASPDSRSLYGNVKKLESMSEQHANEGTFSYDVQTGQLYGSRCEANDKNCYIFKVNVKGSAYKESGKLKLGNETYGIGHPFVTQDGKRIYFTSVIEGGYGGADIWYIDRDDKGDYGAPVNLGPTINTAGEEGFPFMVGGILYFASDGHPGVGGLDLFASYLESDGTFSKPFNLRAPFNTSWDDFNLVQRPDVISGLLVSNRKNSESSDDIYMFDGFPPCIITLEGRAYDKETKQYLKDYTVQIFDGKNKILDQTITDGSSYFTYVESGKEYEIVMSAPGYLSSSQTLSTEDVRCFTELVADNTYGKSDGYLGKEDSEPIIEAPETGKEIVLKDIFYEFDKYRLVEDSKKELDKLIALFHEYPEMVVEIGSHTDSRGTDAYNQRLSENRAKSVVDYLVSRGISQKQFTWKGYGESQLLIPNAKNEEEHQANRRTTFKVLTLGPRTENVTVKHISARDMAGQAGGAVDLKGWWLQVHESTSYKQLDLPINQRASNATGKEVRLIKCDDGMCRYCIHYDTRDEAIKGQESLRAAGVPTVLRQFDY